MSMMSCPFQKTGRTCKDRRECCSDASLQPQSKVTGRKRSNTYPNIHMHGIRNLSKNDSSLNGRPQTCKQPDADSVQKGCRDHSVQEDPPESLAAKNWQPEDTRALQVVTKTVNPVTATEQTVVQVVTFDAMRRCPTMEPRFDYFCSIRNADFLQNLKTISKFYLVIEIDFERSKHVNYTTHQTKYTKHVNYTEPVNSTTHY